jgi:8-oxo-dGTP pyrophosphatase MutT (NUDIX family)/6-pyruvoyl-tetrahydropterin synthase
MPKAVSKKQYRYMMAIVHGKDKGKTSARGDRVPASVAGKYAGSGSSSSAPESKGKEHEGGKWGEKHHEKAKATTNKDRLERKKKKAHLRKSLEKYLIKNNRQGAGCLVVNADGQILLGKRSDSGMWATPGGHVDPGENFEEAARRELREESGLVAKDCVELNAGRYRGYETKQYIVTSYKGRLKGNGEMLGLQFFDPYNIPWDELTDYTRDAICAAIKDKLSKSNKLKDMIAMEELEKNIIRSGGAPHNTVYEVTHGDALRLIGNGTFRMLRDAVKDMGDEEFRELKVDNYTLNIRRHVSDVYSGRITDGVKQVHQFTNKSLPAVSAELMSVFEWYLPEDEKELEIVDETDLDGGVIEGGLNELIDNYKRHNIVNIYTEMENIREELRHGMVVDIQQVEQRMMKLFDKLESTLLTVVDKHNTLNNDAGESVDVLEDKLMQLQERIEQMSKQPVTVSAYSSSPSDDKQVHSEFYPYLTRPSVSISPDGHIKISFDSDWTHMERENFLNDMKARAVKQQAKK